MNEVSTIRDIRLAADGQRKIDWVKQYMPVLNSLRDQYIQERPFAGKKIVICLHLEAKTAYLALTIQAGGGEVAVVASNPLSTQDDVVAALVENGIRAHAWHGATDEEYKVHINKALDFGPDYIIDDGGDLVSTIHTCRRELIGQVRGGAEETTTGILRLKAMSREGKLEFPMMAVNDARSKYLFDNRYGTGQSVWDAILRTTNLVVAGKTVCIVGYGWCGKGVALRARGLGAKIIICEVDPVKANEAWMDGYEVMPMKEAASMADYFITVTGNKNVITKDHFARMKNGAILANAGHFDVEISKQDLSLLAVSKRKVRPNTEEFTLEDGRKIFLLAEGRLVNLAAGDGHPVEVMDMSFALQALALEYLVKNQGLENKVFNVPEQLDNRVALMKLHSLGLQIDSLTSDQAEYLAGWVNE
ncbi:MULTISPECIES: adenosylhomocysteinase [Dehalobacter]|jgi:adenosylhomocysteinase|uniref:Adenosylhomocysteinase n=2 Tax=Dehalobacter restrictus TaxID=55583 RepID=A0A857DIM0_9FIRM|nr:MULTISPECIES: adenosylhomocysteinase [Dehalobacter]AHF09726.1 S-adenosyl-L-homocysteine hydrolase [Dehalobacter restrictus DSM 9455]MCG1025365.1 adenosylhomocysteinase [Dehalobacter sp.]OCZ52726.1 adenosylhomocysteinase [Dehalobacter sp. TeCB1]QHA00319.1 adenosylhomocysteinase [Dehalobacter restrictus]